MKKLLLLVFASFCFYSQAQSIAAGNGSPDVQIQAGGQIMQGGVQKGMIFTDGSIKNMQDVVIGSVSDSGIIKNASGTIVGYFTESYQVKNANDAVIGWFRSNRDVLTAADVVIGTYSHTVKPAWSAVAYFFFQP